MIKSRLLRFSACLAAPLILAHCGGEESPGKSCEPGDPGCAQAGTGGSGASGGTAGTTGGTAGKAGSGSGATGGTTAATGGVSATGGTTATGGVSATGGTTAATGGVSATGGTTATGGMSATGGMPPTAGTAGMAGTPTVDENGIPLLAKPGDQKTNSREYLNLGEMRLINNKWGSDELGCNTMMRIFVNNDRSVGWEFNRPTCGGGGAKPDYPEIEFGVHPFGRGNVLETSPPFSTTALLPLQIKNITSSSATLDNLNLALQSAVSWNISFEFWLSQRNPVTDPNPGVHAELIVFWGWQNGRWPCDKTGDVNSANKTYRLCHQDDQWADGQWRYFQFWDTGGPNNNFSGKIDVKPFLDWLVNQNGYSPELWVTRFEIGSEIDDNTSGTGTVRNVTFEVNNTSKSLQLGQ